ncbi:stearoyl-CoA desaturase 5-like isoform X1 [Varroa jacobsoni]|uniref:Fatty acid desaturase domain-containing protein n=1 Tax=Varroa destructor TaxID=109461 RepID=A0A7M7JD27_VARDE|nr:stearoyl-CoA desaturase 5-like [Varroa destructor]XP_022690725.1 stearoyl-CoA desaturase 5-like isoform X1 [Varroa jacobsoni]
MSITQSVTQEELHKQQRVKGAKFATADDYRIKLVWRNVILMGYLHIISIYGLYLIATQAMWKTVGWAYIMYFASCLGITAGAHRLWAHRTYKAKLPLKIFLAFCQSMAFQNHIMEWARDHRVHHKYSETNADPHNAKRGFFFSHVGWLLCRKHPDVIEKGRKIDLSDLQADPVVAFQKRHYLKTVLICCFIFPAVIPMFLWGETFLNAFVICSLTRYCISLNVTWLVNSAAHMWGHKPYDTNINPVENWGVSVGAIGEGWHNYHHTFPHDYKAAELPYTLNPTTLIIDFFALIGWAYDRRSVSAETIKARKMRTGWESLNPEQYVETEHPY